MFKIVWDSNEGVYNKYVYDTTLGYFVKVNDQHCSGDDDITAWFNALVLTDSFIHNGKLSVTIGGVIYPVSEMDEFLYKLSHI